jgi:thiol-disulfide isomerase/thioredoxin
MMQARFNFWTPSLLVFGILLFFWGTSLIKVFSSPDAFFRFPSSYDKDASLPVPQRISDAKTPRLLVEFYQDSCVTCQQIAPMLYEISEQKSFQRCLSVLPIDADKAEPLRLTSRREDAEVFRKMNHKRAVIAEESHDETLRPAHVFQGQHSPLPIFQGELWSG